MTNLEKWRGAMGAGFVAVLVAIIAATTWLVRNRASSEIVAVTYDATHELFAELEAKFEAEGTGELRTFHGGSAEQARTVVRGVRADVLLLASELDIDSAVDAGLIANNWRDQFPWQSSPYTSTIVFLVRAENPKSILDWTDLSRSGVDLVATHPDVSGAGRLAYLAVWHAGSALTNNPEIFARSVYSRVHLLRMGARQAVSTFTRMRDGDVLLTWENEAIHAVEEFGGSALEVVYPKESILAEPAVAIVDHYVEQRDSRAAAERFVRLLFSEEGQQIAARNYLRPRANVQSPSRFPALRFFSVPQAYGSWEQANRLHFSPNGTFHQILRERQPSTFGVP